jgi:hypothetical protein
LTERRERGKGRGRGGRGWGGGCAREATGGGSAWAAPWCLPVRDCLLYVREESTKEEGEEKRKKRKEEGKEKKKRKREFFLNLEFSRKKNKR